MSNNNNINNRIIIDDLNVDGSLFSNIINNFIDKGKKEDKDSLILDEDIIALPKYVEKDVNGKTYKMLSQNAVLDKEDIDYICLQKKGEVLDLDNIDGKTIDEKVKSLEPKQIKVDDNIINLYDEYVIMEEYGGKMGKMFGMNDVNFSLLIKKYINLLSLNYVNLKDNNFISVIDDIISDKEEILKNFVNSYNFDKYNYEINELSQSCGISIEQYYYNEYVYYYINVNVPKNLLSNTINAINTITYNKSIGNNNIKIEYINFDDYNVYFRINNVFGINVEDNSIKNKYILLLLLYVFVFRMKTIFDKLDEIKIKLLQDINRSFYFNKHLITFTNKKEMLKTLLSIKGEEELKSFYKNLKHKNILTYNSIVLVDFENIFYKFKINNTKIETLVNLFLNNKNVLYIIVSNNSSSLEKFLSKLNEIIKKKDGYIPTDIRPNEFKQLFNMIFYFQNNKILLNPTIQGKVKTHKKLRTKTYTRTLKRKLSITDNSLNINANTDLQGKKYATLSTIGDESDDYTILFLYTLFNYLSFTNVRLLSNDNYRWYKSSDNLKLHYVNMNKNSETKKYELDTRYFMNSLEEKVFDNIDNIVNGKYVTSEYDKKDMIKLLENINLKSDNENNSQIHEITEGVNTEEEDSIITLTKGNKKKKKQRKKKPQSVEAALAEITAEEKLKGKTEKESETKKKTKTKRKGNKKTKRRR